MLRVLLIDDEDVLRNEVAAYLRECGHEAFTAGDGEEGLARAAEVRPDVVLCDLLMPKIRGVEVLDILRKRMPETQVVLITAFATIETAVYALRNGAADYVTKPLDLADLDRKLRRLAERKALLDEVHTLRQRLGQRVIVDGLMGQSKTIQEIRKVIDAVADTQTTVLILGETGTGKEVVARTLHDRSGAGAKRFIAVNCAAIPEALIESELFGHVRGAFTGADRDKVGLIEAAQDGTLFLDEIGEMPLATQAKLLRVLEERAIRRVGAFEKIPVKVRIIAATNRDLLQLSREGKFREDLYYRIKVAEIIMPPLRERLTDIPPLAGHFVEFFNRELGREVLGVSNDAMDALVAYAWPGNVRELRNAIERAMLFQRQGYLELHHFPEEIRPQAASPSTTVLKDALREFEIRHIQRVLALSGGNREEAAKLLGVDRSTLYRKLSE